MRDYYGDGYGRMVTASGGRRMYVENRELYTSYRLYLRNGKVFWHDIRNCTPLPNCQPRIIYARTIPWFMWLIYWIRDLGRKWRDWRSDKKQRKRDAETKKQLISYQKRVLERQFIQKSGRYK